MSWKKKDTSTSIDEIIRRNTGLTKSELDKDWNTPIANLYEVAKRLKKIATEGKTVTVFADYDCDGICSAVIMHLVLKTLKIGFNIMFPRRSTGYGLQKFNVDNITSDVIITIDNGISCFEAVDAAKAKGIEVIIIDHHLKPVEGVPNANLIVDPHVFKNDIDYFEDWCGAGLGYELSRLICSEKIQNVALQFAAIATVADVVPLLKDNRKILINGLKLINDNPIPAIKKFTYEISGSMGKPYVDETTIGFKIGPIINAMGRIEDNAEYVYKYFITGDAEMLQHMVEVNEKRKELVASAVDRAYAIIAEECLFADIPMIIYDPNTIEGIVGIVAGRLAETQNIPVICLTNSDTPGIVKGSARSPSINIKDTLDKVSDLLEGYGGHAGAAGLSLKEENIDELRNRFAEMFADYENGNVVEPEIEYDLEINADEVEKTVEELKKFAPFGEGNPNPVFKIQNFDLFSRQGAFYKCLGDGQTLKLFGNHCSAIGFDMVAKYNDTGLAKSLNLIGMLSENHFGKPEAQIELIDFEPINAGKEKSDLAQMLENTLLGF